MSVRIRSSVVLIAAQVVLSALGSAGAQTTWYVNDDAGPPNGCTSWVDACPDLQTALSLANSGDQIWVAAGTYTPAGPAGERTATFQLESGVALYGGFAGTEDPQDPLFTLADRDFVANQTILSGDLDGNDAPVACTVNSPDCNSFGGLCGDDGFCIIATNNTENSYHVVTGSGTNATALLDGFTITAGNGNGGAPHNRGGGMWNEVGSPTVTLCTFTSNSVSSLGGGMANTAGSSPTVSDCVFRGNATSSTGAGAGMYNLAQSHPMVNSSLFSKNSAGFFGGGMYNINGSNPTVTNCTFEANTADYGGGMGNSTASGPTVVACIFNENVAVQGGGMVNINASPFTSPVLVDCTFSNNSTSSSGGGMRNDSCSPDVTRCLFIGNSAGGGGGISCAQGSSPIVTSCTFLGNLANTNGGGILISGAGSPTTAILTNCAFSGNSALRGGGIYSSFSDASTVVNCTFNANAASIEGGGMHSSSSSHPLVTNSILWANTDNNGQNDDESAQVYQGGGNPSINYSIVQGGWSGAGGIGVLDADPLFVDPDGPDNISGTADDDLRLTGTSPAADAGDNTVVPADSADLDGDGDVAEHTPLDLEGNSRFLDNPFVGDSGVPEPPYPLIVDMGAFEYRPPIFVNDDAGGINDGSSWADAMNHLQDALDFAEASGIPEIWVAAGTYTPDQGDKVLPGDRTVSFALRNGVAIYGGFNGTETALGQRNPTANVTVLSGDLNGDDCSNQGCGVLCAELAEAIECFSGDQIDELVDPSCAQYTGCDNDVAESDLGICDNSIHVVAGINVDSTAVLDGFTITAGRACPDGLVSQCLCPPDAPPDTVRGAGIYLGTSSPQIRHCRVVANLAGGSGEDPNTGFSLGENVDGYGAGAYLFGGSAQLLDVVFQSNTALLSGGGLYTSLFEGLPIVQSCAFQSNRADWAGGGLFAINGDPLENSFPTVLNTKFLGNRSVGYDGGGVWLDLSGGSFTNCLFSGNRARRGGGLAANDGSAPTLVNCTFSRNRADQEGGGLAAIPSISPSVPLVRNSIFWGNMGGAGQAAQVSTAGGTPDIKRSIIQSCSTLCGVSQFNFNLDPLFVDADGADDSDGTADDDLGLQAASPAIDAGNNLVVPTDSTDVDQDGDGTERFPVDLAGSARFLETPATPNIGIADPPDYWAIVDLGAFEFFPDCNGNSVLDELEISDGLANDCNTNGIPDACDIDSDSTASGGPFYCVTVCSADCNNDAIPDECQVAVEDCNDSGVPDNCELLGNDCDGNMVPDECDLAAMTYPDCDANAIPDVCELDCNENGVADSCDLVVRTSQDCNANGTPDECDIDPAGGAPGGPYFCVMACDPDCDDNGVPDVCDLAACAGNRDCADCNANSVPDACDIAVGTLTDTTPMDGEPDECVEFDDQCIDNSNWSCANNWEADDVPGDDNPLPAALDVESAVIGLAGTTVTLDIDATVDSLVVINGAILNISGGNLTIDGTFGIFVDGGVSVADGFAIIAEAAFAISGPQPLQLAGASAGLSSAAPADVISNFGIISGQGFIEATLHNAASGVVRAAVPGLLARRGPRQGPKDVVLQITGGNPQVNDGVFEATAGTVLLIDTPVTGGGAFVANLGTIEIQADITENPPGSDLSLVVIGGGTITIGVPAGGLYVEGCGPVIIDPEFTNGSIVAMGSGLQGASSWTVGNDNDDVTADLELLDGSVGLVNGPVIVNANGTLTISNSELTADELIVAPGGTVNLGSSLALDHGLVMTASDPSAWSLQPDAIVRINGGVGLPNTSPQGYAELEVGCDDLGVDPAGFSGPFGIPVLEIGPGAHLSLFDRFANTSGACEALYVDTLRFTDAAGRLNRNGLNLYYNTLEGSPGQIVNLVVGNGCADLNHDGMINAVDLAQVLGNWGPCPGCAADFNGNNLIDAADLAQLLGSWTSE